MSIRVTTAIWDESRAKLGDRLVLLYIADRCNDDGRGAYPSIATISQHCQLSARSVQMSIKRLVALGELAVDYGAGPKGVNQYQVILKGCKICTPEESAGVKKTTQTPAESAPGGCKTAHLPPAESAPNTSVNTSTEPPTEPSSVYTAEFEVFWAQYPKEHGVKKASFARWKQLSPEKRRQAMESLAKFKDGKRWQEGFIVDCQKFLRDEQFETPPEPWTRPEPIPIRANGRASPPILQNGHVPTREEMLADWYYPAKEKT